MGGNNIISVPGPSTTPGAGGFTGGIRRACCVATWVLVLVIVLVLVLVLFTRVLRLFLNS